MYFLVYLREHILFPRTSFAASPSRAVDFSQPHVMMSTPVINGLSIHFTYLLLSSNCSQNLPPWSSAFLLLNSVYGFLNLRTTWNYHFFGGREDIKYYFIRKSCIVANITKRWCFSIKLVITLNLIKELKLNMMELRMTWAITFGEI